MYLYTYKNIYNLWSGWGVAGCFPERCEAHARGRTRGVRAGQARRWSGGDRGLHSAGLEEKSRPEIAFNSLEIRLIK